MLGTQSVLIDRNMYSFDEALTLLGYLGKKFIKVDFAKNFYRFRQFNPGNTKFKIVKDSLVPGIEYVIAY